MVKEYRLEAQQQVLYTWDEPNGKQELLWGWVKEGASQEEEEGEEKKDDYKILPIRVRRVSSHIMACIFGH